MFLMAWIPVLFERQCRSWWRGVHTHTHLLDAQMRVGVERLDLNHFISFSQSLRQHKPCFLHVANAETNGSGNLPVLRLGKALAT